MDDSSRKELNPGGSSDYNLNEKSAGIAFE